MTDPAGSQPAYVKLAQLKSVDSFQQHLQALRVALPVDERILTAAAGSPLAEPLDVGGVRVGNRWCIHPMEGWDAEPDGSPSELTLRRWRHFGLSGAKWIWGGEAAAVQPDGRANPRQTLATPDNLAGLTRLRETLVAAHRERFGTTEDLLVGLQLTHSGRFSRPHGSRLEPRIAYHHPLLDEKFGIDPGDASLVWTDQQLDDLVDRYVAAAGTAWRAGYQFVDVKACHGYLLHEFLSARRREGRYGGDLEGRTRLLTTIVEAVQAAWPELMVAVRLSVFDALPYRTGREVGRPMTPQLPYDDGFGVDPDDPGRFQLDEPLWLMRRLQQLGVVALNVSCGSPYYNPHIQRPAIFPPSDGYLPPEDPLVGVARQLEVARRCREAVPGLPLVGSGYSYLQDYLPHVAQAAVREGWIDAVGLGRMVLSYPDLPADVLERGQLQRKRVCRTFSDCTTAPRHGLVSGCYPLDAHYKQLEEFDSLQSIKRNLKS